MNIEQNLFTNLVVKELSLFNFNETVNFNNIDDVSFILFYDNSKICKHIEDIFDKLNSTIIGVTFYKFKVTESTNKKEEHFIIPYILMYKNGIMKQYTGVISEMKIRDAAFSLMD
jgi:hypothetical protein